MSRMLFQTKAAAACLALSLTSCAHAPSAAEEGLAGTSDTHAGVHTPDLAGDSTADAVPATPIPVDSGPAKHPEERCNSLVGAQRIRRVAVNEVVAAGLGQWLSGVQIERVLEGRKFKGWRIVVLHLANPCYAAVDLRPGDVVTAVNGKGPKALERPESSQEIFESLKKASAIEVNYMRDGKAKVIRFDIDEVPQP